MAAEETEGLVVAIRDGDEAIELVAEQIEKLAEAADRLARSGLTERAVLVLLRDQTNLPMGEIRLVLRSLPRLREYLTDG